jgi:hypothetical protein
METTDNPFIGVWAAEFNDASNQAVSHMQFLDNMFYYYVIRFDKGEEISRVSYNGKYTYNENSNVIFFEIEEPASEARVTSSYYQFYGDKLYCYGKKIFVTEELHEKYDHSKFTQN